eukprot:m.240887 g.240887  ORF g.240887 m.240887 type:complete len:915 (-) comp15316_c2_seq4:2793-5537(-)
MPEMDWRVITAKVLVFLIWPLVIILPIATTTDVSNSGNSLFICFALLPHWLIAALWVAGRVFGLFDVERLFLSTVEMVVGSVIMGVLAPIAVLTPILQVVPLSTGEHTTLLGNMLLLCSLWFPILCSLVQTPLVLEATASEQTSDIDQLDRIDAEVRFSYLGYFGALSVPLGMLLPMYLAISVSPQVGAFLMFLLLSVGCACTLLNVCHRWGMVLAHVEGIGLSRTVTIALVKFVTCGIFLPLFIMLPLYMRRPIPAQSAGVLLAFIIALPSLTLLDVVRTLLQGVSKHMYIVAGIVFMVVLFPLAVLLPAFVASKPTFAGEVCFLVFMLTPLVTFLSYLIYYTAKVFHNMPFYPLSLLLHAAPWWVEVLYSLLVLAIPVIILVPVQFKASLSPNAQWVVLGFLLLILVLMAVILTVSCCVRSPSDHLPTKVTPTASTPKRRKSSLKDTISGPSDFVHKSGMGHAIVANATDLPQAGHTHAPRKDSASFEFRGPAAVNFDLGDFDRSRANTGVMRSDTMDSVLLDDSVAVKARASAISSGSHGAAVVMPGHHVPGNFSTQGWVAQRRSSTSSLARRPSTSSLGRQSNLSQEEPAAMLEIPRPVSAIEEANPETTRPESQVEEQLYQSIDLPDATPGMLVDGWEDVNSYVLAPEGPRLKREEDEVKLHIYSGEEMDVRQGDYFNCYSTYCTTNQLAYVLKWPVYTTMQTESAALIALRKFQRAKTIADSFNAALQQCGIASTVEIVIPRVVQLLCRPVEYRNGDQVKNIVPYAMLEPDLEDTPAHRDETAGVLDYFCMWNDAFGGVVSQQDMQGEEEDADASWVTRFHELNDTAQALSCYSYFSTQQQCLLMKLQGVGLVYTSPDFHFSDNTDPYLSPSNQGSAGISSFFSSHKHNHLCHKTVSSLPNFQKEWLE